MSAPFQLLGVADVALHGAEAFIRWASYEKPSLSSMENPYSAGSSFYCAWREGWNRAAKAAEQPKARRDL